MKNQKNLKPGWRKSLVHSIPSKNENLVIAVKHYRINRYQRFLVIFIFAWFLYFAQLIFSWIPVIANWISRWSHCVNSVQIQSFFRSVYSRLELNTEIYSVNLRVQPEQGKIGTRKNSVFGHFSRSVFE